MAVEFEGPTVPPVLQHCGAFWAVVPDREWVFGSQEQAEEVADQGENLRVVPVQPHFVNPHAEANEPDVPLSFFCKFWVVVSENHPDDLNPDPDGCEMFSSLQRAEEVRDQGQNLRVREVVLLVIDQ